MAKREPAAEQLTNYKQANQAAGTLSTAWGAPIGQKLASMTVGPRGPVVLQDLTLLDELAHFDRERIPERVVHAKGAGAHGYLEVTHDMTPYCRAAPFSAVGKRTPVFVRFSTVGGESGSADTARDPRGFAIKFYTEQGNWDLVGNNTPIFFIRDPIHFPSFIHTQKRNPVTHLKDADMTWDFITQRPETTHQVMFLFSDRGTPDGYRFMNGYGSHTFKLVNDKAEAVYCKFHFKSAQGIKCLAAERAERLAGSDPDYAIADLYNAIARGDPPVWNMFIQVMTFAQADQHPDNPFDLTKVWSHADYPLLPVGRLVLDRNPANYFAEVEQAAFSPAHLIPGIEPSPDKVLQGRLFSYTDTHYHRLGANYRQLPINCPLNRAANAQRDAAGCMHNQDGTPNYVPNSFHGPVECPTALEHSQQYGGHVARYDSKDEDNFSQPTVFWSKTLDESGRKRLVANVAASLAGAADWLQQRAVAQFGRVHADFGSMLHNALALDKQVSADHTPIEKMFHV